MFRDSPFRSKWPPVTRLLGLSLPRKYANQSVGSAVSIVLALIFEWQATGRSGPAVGYDDIVGARGEAWDFLINDPDKIISIGHRP
jgi:hypothetical protein